MFFTINSIPSNALVNHTSFYEKFNMNPGKNTRVIVVDETKNTLFIVFEALKFTFINYLNPKFSKSQFLHLPLLQKERTVLHSHLEKLK